MITITVDATTRALTADKYIIGNAGDVGVEKFTVIIPSVYNGVSFVDKTVRLIGAFSDGTGDAPALSGGVEGDGTITFEVDAPDTFYAQRGYLSVAVSVENTDGSVYWSSNINKNFKANEALVNFKQIDMQYPSLVQSLLTRIEAEYEDAEDARDGLYDTAESSRGGQYASAEAARDALYDAAEASRNAWGVYSSETAYTVGNKVYYLGSSYVCIADSTGNSPTNASYWRLIAEKGEKGDPGDLTEAGLKELIMTEFTGKNMIDKSAMISGEYIVQTNGNVGSDALSKRTDWLEIDPSSTYYLSGDTFDMRYALYTDIAEVYGSETYISGEYMANDYDTDETKTNKYSHEITTPANAHYIRVSFKDTSGTKIIQLEKDTYTAWEAYVAPIYKFSGGYCDDEMSDTSENPAQNKIVKAYVDAATSPGATASRNLFNKDTAIIGEWYDGNGVYQTSGQSGSGINSVSDYIEAEAETEYINSGACITSFFNAAKEMISTTNSTLSIVPFTTPTGCAYVRISFIGSELGYFQLIEGDTVEEYEAFADGNEGKYGADYPVNYDVARRFAYRPLYVRSMAEAVAARVQAVATTDTLSFLWITDSHITQKNILHSASIAAAMTKYTPCKFAAHGGDIVHGVTARENELKYMRRYAELLNDAKCPYIQLKGNHDDNCLYARAQATPKLAVNYIQNYEIYNATTRFSEKDIVVGSRSGMYYYLDDEISKIRCIFLNSHETPWEVTDGILANDSSAANAGESGDGTGVKAVYSQDQLNWLATVALDFSDKTAPGDWAVVVFAHMGVEAYTRPFTYILQAFVTGVDLKIHPTDPCNVGVTPLTYADILNGNTMYDYDIDVDYSAVGSRDVIALVLGDLHRDFASKTAYAYYYTIYTLNASSAKDNEYAPTKTPETETETAFDIFTIDRTNKKIYTTRFGAASVGDGIDENGDREISY